MSVEHCSFLRPSLKAKLQDNGILHIEELRGLVQSDDAERSALKKRVPTLTESEMIDIVAAFVPTATHHDSTSRAVWSESAAPPTGFTIRTLADIRRTEAKERRKGSVTHATTFCRSLDALLGGGVPVGCVTEVSGPPGVGKTQLLQQLAVSCVLPVELGGLGGECLYIDTEGSVVADRFYQMVVSAVALVRSIAARTGNAPNPSLQKSQHTGGDQSSVNQASNNGYVGTSSSHTASPSVVSCGVAATTPFITGSSNKRPREEASSESRDADGLPLFSSSTGSGEAVMVTTTTTSSSPQLPSQAGTATAPTPTPLSTLAGNFTADTAMKRVHYLRVTDVTMLMAVLYSLPSWLGERSSAMAEDGHTASPTVRMILIDSIAAPFRAMSLDGDGQQHTKSNIAGKSATWQRTRLLYTCGERLQAYAAQYRLAVVASNQVTTRYVSIPSSRSGASGGSEAGMDRQTILVPALGDTWSYHLSTRLLLSFHHYRTPSATLHFRVPSAAGCREDIALCTMLHAPVAAPQAGGGSDDDKGIRPHGTASVESVAQHRVARLLKSPCAAAGECCFAITRKGIRDVVSPKVI